MTPPYVSPREILKSYPPKPGSCSVSPSRIRQREILKSYPPKPGSCSVSPSRIRLWIFHTFPKQKSWINMLSNTPPPRAVTIKVQVIDELSMYTVPEWTCPRWQQARRWPHPAPMNSVPVSNLYWISLTYFSYMRASSIYIHYSSPGNFHHQIM